MAFNLKTPVSSSLEVSTVVPFLLISIVEDGVAYPVINPEFATTIPRFPRLVLSSIGADLKSEPTSFLFPLRKSREPVLAIVFPPSFTTFSGAPVLGIEDNTVIFSLSFLANTSTSTCVSSLLFNAFFAFSKSILIAAKVDAGALSLLIFSKSSSTLSILVCNFVLSNTTCFSTVFSVLALLFTAGVFPVANSSFLAGFASSLPGETATPVFFSTTSPALATPAAPKKILAPITTEAAPTLNFLIE